MCWRDGPLRSNTQCCRSPLPELLADPSAEEGQSLEDVAKPIQPRSGGYSLPELPNASKSDVHDTIALSLCSSTWSARHAAAVRVESEAASGKACLDLDSTASVAPGVVLVGVGCDSAVLGC